MVEVVQVVMEGVTGNIGSAHEVLAETINTMICMLLAAIHWKYIASLKYLNGKTVVHYD
jgi:hypothetical protein